MRPRTPPASGPVRVRRATAACADEGSLRAPVEHDRRIDRPSHRPSPSSKRGPQYAFNLSMLTCVLQFANRLAFRCGLPRPTSQVIHHHGLLTARSLLFVEGCPTGVGPLRFTGKTFEASWRRHGWAAVAAVDGDPKGRRCGRDCVLFEPTYKTRREPRMLSLARRTRSRFRARPVGQVPTTSVGPPIGEASSEPLPQFLCRQTVSRRIRCR